MLHLSKFECPFMKIKIVPPKTIGGLLTECAGRIPRPGERFVIQDLEFDVLEATPARLQRVLIRPGPVRAVRLMKETR